MDSRRASISPGLLWVLIVALLAAVFYFGWFFWNDLQSKTPPPLNLNSTQPEASQSPVSSIAPPKTFKSESYFFQLQFPGNWIYSEELPSTQEKTYVYKIEFKDDTKNPPLIVMISDVQKKMAILSAPDSLNLTVDQAVGEDLLIGGQKAKKYLENIYVTSFQNRIYTFTGGTISSGALEEVIESIIFIDVAQSEKINYENEKYQYSFTYPVEGWYVYGYRDGDETIAPVLSIALKDDQDRSHYIAVSKGDNAEIEAGLVESIIRTNFKQEQINFLGQKAIRYTWTNVINGEKISDNVLIKVAKGEYNYYLSGIVEDFEKINNKDRGIFNQILSSFKFN